VNQKIVDDLASSVRTAVSDAATAGLTAFGGAAVLALGEMAKSAFIGGHATAGGETLAQTLATAFGTDLCGCVAQDVDANGLTVGDATVKTHLVAFASGQAPAPIDDVVVEHAFAFALGHVAALDVAAKITLKAVCAFDPNDRKPKLSTATKIKLDFGWSSEPKATLP
jgi:hypothetical protein